MNLKGGGQLHVFLMAFLLLLTGIEWYANKNSIWALSLCIEIFIEVLWLKF